MTCQANFMYATDGMLILLLAFAAAAGYIVGRWMSGFDDDRKRDKL